MDIRSVLMFPYSEIKRVFQQISMFVSILYSISLKHEAKLVAFFSSGLCLIVPVLA